MGRPQNLQPRSLAGPGISPSEIAELDLQHEGGGFQGWANMRKLPEAGVFSPELGQIEHKLQI